MYTDNKLLKKSKIPFLGFLSTQMYGGCKKFDGSPIYQSWAHAIFFQVRLSLIRYFLTMDRYFLTMDRYR